MLTHKNKQQISAHSHLVSGNGKAYEISCTSFYNYWEFTSQTQLKKSLTHTVKYHILLTKDIWRRENQSHGFRQYWTMHLIFKKKLDYCYYHYLSSKTDSYNNISL